MELFTITCTTCQQRLKVCDASTIGEIQICPKCGSMVLVEPPPGWSEPPAAEPPAPSLPGGPGLPTTLPEVAGAAIGASPPPPTAEISIEAEDASAAEFGVDGAELEPPPVDAALAPPPRGEETAAGEPVLPTEAWMSQAARQRQQWLMVGGAAIVGVALALGVLGFLASRGGKADPTELAASTPATTPGGGPAVGTQPQMPRADAPQAAVPPVAATSSTAGSTAEAAKPASAPATSAPATLPPENVTPPKPADSPVAKPPGSADSKPGDAPKAATQPSAEELTLKPAAPKESATDTAALSETLKAFAPFIDPNVNTVPTESMDTAGQEAPKPDEEAITTEQPSVPRPEPRQIDLPARLQDKIAEVEFTDVPLEAFLRFVMNFSTVPISLDPDALALVRASPRTKVSVRKTDATVDQLLTAALGPLQLAHVAIDQQLVVTRSPPAGGELRTHAHSVSDLVANDPQQLQQLADLIVEMVEPATWEAAGGPGVIRDQMPALMIQQRDTILFQAIVFCERLRAARGLPPQSKFNPELFSLEPRWTRAAARLAKRVTLNFPQPASFTRILHRLSEEAGVEIIVDWQALATLGWTPDTESTLAANQQPIGEVLNNMLQPMELTYRVVDATTVQVTAPATVEARWDVEFYPVKELQTPDETPEAFLARIRREWSGGDSGPLPGVLHYDVPSRHLIAALPQPQQRRLADLLMD